MNAMLEGLRVKGSNIYQGQGGEPAPAKPAPKRPVARVAKPASQKSIDFLRVLLSEREGVPAAERIRNSLNESRQGNAITQMAVSSAIDRLLAIPRAKAPAKARKPRPNRIAQRCEHCGRMVPEGVGELIRDESAGRWIVTHIGECPTAYPFPEGRYAVPNAEGKLRFYHAAEEGLFVLSSDTEQQVEPKAAAAIIAKIALDPKGSAASYGQEYGTCGICGRGLTDPTSRERGIGPVCAEKF